MLPHTCYTSTNTRLTAVQTTRLYIETYASYRGYVVYAAILVSMVSAGLGAIGAITHKGRLGAWMAGLGFTALSMLWFCFAFHFPMSVGLSDYCRCDHCLHYD
jgi:hypothetical protein